MATVQANSRLSTQTQTVVFCGLSISLMAVSAWISLPIWLVPVTLQTFVMVFVVLLLTPRQCLISITGYLLLGAIGLPVFSSMRGGIGVLAGPTGGFLWGFLLAAIIALTVLGLLRTRFAAAGMGAGKLGGGKERLKDWESQAVSASGLSSGSAGTSRLSDGFRTAGLPKGRRGFVVGVVTALVFLVVMYCCGWFQLVFVTGMTPEAAFAVGVAPFVVIDTIKSVAAIFVAQAVGRAIL